MDILNHIFKTDQTNWAKIFSRDTGIHRLTRSSISTFCLRLVRFKVYFELLECFLLSIFEKSTRASSDGEGYFGNHTFFSAIGNEKISTFPTN